MKTPRKRLTLKTPKRSTKTPLKVVRPEKPTHADSRQPPSDFKTLLSDLEAYENKLLESYRKENQMLRSLLETEGNTVEGSSPLKDLLGLDVKERDNEYNVSYRVGEKSLSFVLVPNEDMFVYKPGTNSNLELPDFLSEEISFERQQINKFFYKVMEVMISKNV